MAARIKYIKGDLFSVTNGVLAHACNCHGSWGGGIARMFATKFPQAYEEYNAHCKATPASKLLGSCQLIDAGKFQIACLFTNDNSSNSEVVDFTKRSMLDLASKIPKGTVVNMPKINSGIFNVPWELTEKALTEVDVPVVVYTLD